MMESNEWVRGSPDYPESLASLASPPISVRVVGSVDTASPRIAIVGTRRADDEAIEFTFELAATLASHGVVVVSGGAVGIDAAAHRGALSTGRTLAILPTGFAPSYPRSHRELFAAIAGADSGSGLVSELPDGTPPQKWTFLRRNELIAGLSDAVVVVQAPRESGALSTAAVARHLGRPVFVVPASPWDPRGIGGLDLLSRGARICTGAHDVLPVTALGPTRCMTSGRGPRPVAQPIGLAGDELSVLRGLGARPRHPDEIARSAGIPVERVQRALLGLLLAGRVDERDGGRYVTAPPKV